MHQRVLRKSQTLKLPHVEKAFSNVAINKLVNLKIPQNPFFSLETLLQLTSGPPSAAFACPSGMKGTESVPSCHIYLQPSLDASKENLSP